MRPPIDGGTILITGASSGIGREIARQLAPRAGALALVARRAERLEELRAELLAARPGLRVHLLPCDLADEAATEEMLRTLAAEVGPVDILVNNAGFGYQGLYERAEWGRIERMIRVNVLAPALLTNRLVGPMVERGRGGILNISSGAGLSPVPGLAAYSGTKHFLSGFSEAIRAELADAGVVVTHVCPGPVATEFDEAMGVREGVPGAPSFLEISAEQCTRDAIRGFERGRALVFPGRVYRSAMRLFPLAPRALQRVGARAMARRLRSIEAGMVHNEVSVAEPLV